MERNDRWSFWNVVITALDDYGIPGVKAGFFQANDYLDYDTAFDDVMIAFPPLVSQSTRLSLWHYLSPTQLPTTMPTTAQGVHFRALRAKNPIYVDPDTSRTTYELALHEITCCHVVSGPLQLHIDLGCAQRINLDTIPTAPEEGTPLIRSSFTLSSIRLAISSPTRYANPGADDEHLVDEAMIVNTTSVNKADWGLMVKRRDQKCVVSGSSCGPGVEAVHIVPQAHWVAYPLPEDSSSPAIDTTTLDSEHPTPPHGSPHRLPHLRECIHAKSTLQQRFSETWNIANGLTMRRDLRALHKAHLVAIHPVTHKIRLFAHIEGLLQYHGLPARISENNRRALQLHYNQCVIHNVCAVQLQYHDASEKSIMNLPSFGVLYEMGIRLKAVPRSATQEREENIGKEVTLPSPEDFQSHQGLRQAFWRHSLAHSNEYSPPSLTNPSCKKSRIDVNDLHRRLARLASQMEHANQVQAWKARVSQSSGVEIQEKDVRTPRAVY